MVRFKFSGVSRSEFQARRSVITGRQGRYYSSKTLSARDNDPMGRPTSYWQCTPLNCGTSSIWAGAYNYDLAGDVTSWNHPAGYTITQTINAAQQVQQITSSLSDASPPGALAARPRSSIQYTPGGAVGTRQNGCGGSGCTNVQETYAYNNRLQKVRREPGTTVFPYTQSFR